MICSFTHLAAITDCDVKRDGTAKLLLLECMFAFVISVENENETFSKAL